MSFHVLNSKPVGDSNHQQVAFLPACYPHWRGLTEGGPWRSNTFETFEDALEYCRDWLGDYAPDDMTRIKVNEPYSFNGYDYVVILKL